MVYSITDKKLCFTGGTYGKKNIAAYLAVLLLLTSFMAYLGIVPPKPIFSPKGNKDITYKDIRIAFVNKD